MLHYEIKVILYNKNIKVISLYLDLCDNTMSRINTTKQMEDKKKKIRHESVMPDEVIKK